MKSMKSMKRWILATAAVALALVFATTLSLGQTFGEKKKRPKFRDFGNAVINN